MSMNIQTLNLDRNFKPFEGRYSEIQFTTLDFYSGIEPHIKLDPNSFNFSDDMITLITGRPANGNDLIRIFLATDAVHQLKKEAKIWLFLPFVPFARQDRVCEVGEPLSIKVFVALINSQKYDRVFIFDPHSDVAPALVDNSCVITNYRFVETVRMCIAEYNELKPLNLASPDAGAYKKIFKMAQAINFKNRIAICDKVRDTATGKIIHTTVDVTDFEEQPVLIVDDICDGGRTFIEIAKELKQRNAGNLYLAVSYGIFSNGFEELAQYFTKIFCTNLLKDVDNPLVKQIPVILRTDMKNGLLSL